METLYSPFLRIKMSTHGATALNEPARSEISGAAPNDPPALPYRLKRALARLWQRKIRSKLHKLAKIVAPEAYTEDVALVAREWADF